MMNNNETNNNNSNADSANNTPSSNNNSNKDNYNINNTSNNSKDNYSMLYWNVYKVSEEIINTTFNDMYSQNNNNNTIFELYTSNLNVSILKSFYLLSSLFTISHYHSNNNRNDDNNLFPLSSVLKYSFMMESGRSCNSNTITTSTSTSNKSTSDSNNNTNNNNTNNNNNNNYESLNDWTIAPTVSSLILIKINNKINSDYSIVIEYLRY